MAQTSEVKEWNPSSFSIYLRSIISTSTSIQTQEAPKPFQPLGNEIQTQLFWLEDISKEVHTEHKSNKNLYKLLVIQEEVHPSSVLRDSKLQESHLKKSHWEL